MTKIATRALATSTIPPSFFIKSLAICLSVLLPTLYGCQPQSTEAPQSEGDSVITTDPSKEDLMVAKPPKVEAPEVEDTVLRDRIDSVLEFTAQKRHLSLHEHAAWQILHGVLAFGRDFPLTDANGRKMKAVDHLLAGGQMRGWHMQSGYLLNSEEAKNGAKKRYGLLASMEGESQAAQGHNDQWLAVLSQCDLPIDQEIVVHGETYTIADWVEQIKKDIPRNVEFSWTLICLSKYLSSEESWTDVYGQPWSLEKIVQKEIEADLHANACGGTHITIGVAMALERHRERGGKSTGQWARARQYLDEQVLAVKRNQNEDGTFSTDYFRDKVNSPGLDLHLNASGHTLEFLALHLPKEELEKKWVQKGVHRLCRLFEMTKRYDLECGALYHAAHGLVLYREKVYGERTYLLEEANGTQ
ncbi:MAG: ADP-ribosylation factor-directed GTPase activating protein isoform b [Pirellulaceae bacterium]|nr:ADP-ribosylation factor-directed GTPase activating protein isoform b [Pirellulaceae bacterium]